MLFEKLRQWNLEALVIPHGTTWGSYTPMGSMLDKQLSRTYYDREWQPVIELMSGHGNSEEHRPWFERSLVPGDVLKGAVTRERTPRRVCYALRRWYGSRGA